jgi:hypothetical protein
MPISYPYTLILTLLVSLGSAIPQQKMVRTGNILNEFKAGFNMLPRFDKIERGGEDAIFLDRNVLAIADGVS